MSQRGTHRYIIHSTTNLGIGMENGFVVLLPRQLWWGLACYDALQLQFLADSSHHIGQRLHNNWPFVLVCSCKDRDIGEMLFFLNIE